MIRTKKIQLMRSTGFSFSNIWSKYFYEEKIMLNKLSKLPFNRSFIVRAPHATKL